MPHRSQPSGSHRNARHRPGSFAQPDRHHARKGEWLMIAVRNAVVLVTGGQRGLGAALVEEFLRRGAKKVYVTARKPKPDSRESVVPQALEVRSSQSISDLAKIATDVNIVVNNAGTVVPEPLLTGSFDGVAEQFYVNVHGPVRRHTA